MANTPDTNRPDVTLDSEILDKKMKAAGPIKLKTPAEFKEKMGDNEKDTLDYFRSKDVDFWKRVGHYEKLMKAKAKEEFNDPTNGLLQRMRTLNVSTANRLHLFSRKNAERFAGITSRINVANRTLSAIRKHSVLMKDVAVTQRKGNEGVRQQFLANHGVIARIPYARDLFVPRDKELTKPKELDYEKLGQAATTVLQKETQKRTEWEAAIAKRHPIRSTEEAMREQIQRFQPEAIDEINEALLDHAKGGTKLDDLITALPNTIGLDAGSFEEVKKTLERWAKNLKTKEGKDSKAFELAGRLELTGGAYERVQQIRSYLPLGTHLKVQGNNLPEQEMVLEAKKPDNYLVFKKVGSPEYFTVHTTKRAAWSYVAHSLTEENEYKAQQVSKAVLDEAKKNGVTDAATLKKLEKEVEKAFKTEVSKTAPANPDQTAISKAALAQLGALTLTQPQKDAIKNAAEGTATPNFTPSTPTPTGYAKETDFAHLEFNYA